MIDQCEHCSSRGIVAECEKVGACSLRDNWYAQQLKARNEWLREIIEAAIHSEATWFDRVSDLEAAYKAYKEQEQSP